MKYLVCAIALTTAFAPGNAFAQTDDDTARSFYEAGVAAHTLGRFEVALTAFTQGYELSGRPQFLYNMASCQDRLHRSAEALALYQQYIEALPEDENHDVAVRRMEFLQREIDEAAASNTEADPEPQLVEPVEPIEPATKSAFLSAPALIGFGVGAAGLITFTVAGVIHRSRFSDLQDTCAPGCTDADVTTTSRPALIADIGLGVGVAGLVFGVIYGLVAGPTDNDGGTQVSVSPIRGGSALRLEGQF